MNRSVMANHTSMILVLVLIAACSGCTSIRLNQIVSVTDSGGSGYITRTTGEGYLQIYRGGKSLEARRGMALNPGDEIETTANGSVVIRFAEHGSVTVFPNTRVRIGSLEVFFGKIFADVRGLFTTSGGGVIAGVAGTQYLFEVDKRNVRTIVVEGTVICNSSSGSWAPIRLASGYKLRASAYDQAEAEPRVDRADPGEIRDVLQSVEQIKRAPEDGFCCLKGQVTRALSNNCQGRFYKDRNQAIRGCRPGWCCNKEKVYSTLSYECTGKFYSDKSSAEKACTPPPEPDGYCCENYRIRSSTNKECRGTFYMDAAQAKKACVPPPSPRPPVLMIPPAGVIDIVPPPSPSPPAWPIIQ